MIVLTRIEAIADGTFGRWVMPLYNGVYDPTSPNVRGELFTAEDDWLGNRRGVSCIPEGNYMLRRGWFPKHGEVFQVTGPSLGDRKAILVHPGNTEEDTEGCILLGLRFSTLPVIDEDNPLHPRVVKKSVADSRVAFHRFMGYMQHTDTAPLSIRWAPGVKPPELVGTPV
jgi:hypothetical protein